MHSSTASTDVDHAVTGKTRRPSPLADEQEGSARQVWRALQRLADACGDVVGGDSDGMDKPTM